MKIPSDKLHHVNVVVRDARESAQKMARMYGIANWTIFECGPSRAPDATIHGFKTPYGFLSAFGTTSADQGSITFQLIQPLSGWSIYQEWLITRGEGIIGMAIAEIDIAQFDALKPWLAAQGVSVAQSTRIDDLIDPVQLDTRAALGGFYVELLVSHASDWRERLRVDETWDLSSHVPENGPSLPLTSFQHFGVVVHDLMKVIPQWHRLFGTNQFLFMNWHNASDSLVNPVNNGAPVEHAYFTSTPQIGTMLAYELIQPTFGPSHYKENFLQPLGEGIHHIMAGFLPSRDDWEALETRMAASDVPVCMGGSLGDEIGTFNYLDTRKVLPGYVTEYVFPGTKAPPFDAGFPFTPAMVIDLGEAV